MCATVPTLTWGGVGGGQIQILTLIQPALYLLSHFVSPGVSTFHSVSFFADPQHRSGVCGM